MGKPSTTSPIARACDPEPLPRAEALLHAFDDTASWSIGAEEEFMVVDARTGNLAPAAAPILRRCDPDGPGGLSHEVVQSVVETSTPICQSASEIESSLGAQRMRLARSARDSGCQLLSAGVHPFAAGEQPISPGARYEMLAREYPWIIQEAATYGLHVHVGVQGADRAIEVCNALRGWLPHLLALSVNSPLLHGAPTGLQSTRARLVQLFPRSGPPPIFDGFAGYCRDIRNLEIGDAVEDYTHTWWFVRPHPAHGTVEIRVFDAQTDVRRSAALAALSQALVSCIEDELDRAGMVYVASELVCEENLWSATRHGCDGKFIDEQAGVAVPAREAVLDLLRTLTPQFRRFGSVRYQTILQRMAHRTGAEEQLDQLEAGSGARDLAHRMAEQTVAVSPAG